MATSQGRGRVVLLALTLVVAVLQSPASAENKPYLIFTKDLMYSSSALLTPLTSNFQIVYNLPAILGFVVYIDDSLKPLIQKIPGVLAVLEDKPVKVQTTRSWDFLAGLGSNGQANAGWRDSARSGEDTIIGTIDTGVWPSSKSFRDDDMPEVPSRWKLIGARFFSASIQLLGLLGNDGQPPSQEDLSSPRDFVGHGSHTLSTAGGAPVANAGVFNHGIGTASGGSPRARVASYKACYAPGCSTFDILAAIVQAVEDGVDVLSLSLGSDASDYVADPIAIGAFYAVQKGVTVVCAAGNSGPQPSTVTNVAPWILTVGASTMDRDFPADVRFGGNTIQGQSLSDSTPVGQHFPMISGDKANAANQPTENSTLCQAGTLDPDKVKGKIVVCVRGVNGRMEKGLVVKQAGGVGMVLCNDASNGEDVVADPHLIAAAHCSYSQCRQLLSTLRSTNYQLTGYINARDAEFGVKPAPKVAAFSSRGPNPITPQILKPDVTAPGVGVIAAFTGAVSPTELPFDDRRVPYNIMSGTSMACPHVSGVAGLLKTKYPSWTPAMIKSAIMTTAKNGTSDGRSSILGETGADATPFGYGAGQVNPVQALEPGLVYDTTPADYANFVCALRPVQDPVPGDGELPLPISLPLQTLLPLVSAAGEPVACGRGSSSFRPEDMNYPSIAVPCLSGGSTTVKRRLRNVDAAPGRYAVAVAEPAGVRVTVEPKELYFGVGEEKEFAVRLDVVDAAAAADYVFGSIEWSDGNTGSNSYSYSSKQKHRVRSPIVVRTRCG
ncbi:hypothetical protein ACP4OV_030317 [Aristida adscensionis]